MVDAALATHEPPAIARPKGAMDLAQTLAAVPVVNRAVRQERRGEALVLFVPLRQRWWMNGPVSWWLPLRREKGVALDRLGTEVWGLCDGRRDLESIVETFAGRHRLGFHEARLTVMRFMRLLAVRNLIVLLCPPGDISEEPAPASLLADEGGSR